MTTPTGPQPGEPSEAGDLARLQRLLAASERRAATFAELTALMSEGPEPLALVQRGVELTARATRAAGAFVYLRDHDTDELVLRAGTAGYHHSHLGRIRLRMGEGVTGWVALMRQSVAIPDAPYKDPRFKIFAELRESAFKSMVAVPIMAPGEEVLGVFSLYALKKHAFQDSDVSLATEVGTLLASGLVQAETVAQLQVQSSAAQYLHDLPDDAWGSLDQCLAAMATRCAVDLDADVCIIEVTTDHSKAKGSAGVGLSQAFRDEHRRGLEGRRVDRGVVLPLLAQQGLNRLRIPLGAAAPIGAVTCYRARRFTSNDETLLEGIGAQIAAGALSLYGTERVRPILDQLYCSPDSATTEAIFRRYGWRSRRAWVTSIKARLTHPSDPRSPDDDRTRAVLNEVLAEQSGDYLLLGGGGQYLAVVPGEAHAREMLVRRLRHLAARPDLRLVVGVSPVAQDAAELHAAIRHARRCTNWVELSAPDEGGVIRYEDIAHLQLLPRAALKKVEDVRALIDALSDVVRYDLENGTELARTLDVFLTHSGSAAKSSAELFIHRNTLRQRIQRVEELIGHSPEEFEDSVTAGLAVRIVRESEDDIAAEGDNRRCPHRVLTVGRTCCGMPSTCAHRTTTTAPASGGS